MITYRRMEKEDLDQVAALEAECFSTPWSKQSFLSAIEDENAYFMVAECEGSIIGQCGYYLLYDEADISNVAVTQSYRKNGIGFEMLSELMSYGKKHGVKAFTLEVRKSNIPAIGLYEKLGLSSVGIRPKFYENPTEDAVIMWEKER